MFHSDQFANSIPLVKDWLNRPPLRGGLRLIALVLACFALSPTPNAFGVDPPEGGYPNNNTAVGSVALSASTTGYNNAAVGSEALQSNTVGIANTALGTDALRFNTTGSDNTAVGDALDNNTIGSVNTAIGVSALSGNTTGNYNIAVGFFAGGNLTTGNYNIDIGAAGVAGESKTIRVGRKHIHQATFIAGISGVTVPGGVGVSVGTNGKLGTVVSSERFKMM